MTKKYTLFIGEVNETNFAEAKRFPFYRLGLWRVLAWGIGEPGGLRKATDDDLRMLTDGEQQWLKCCIEARAERLGKRMTKTARDNDRRFLELLDEELRKEADAYGEHNDPEKDGGCREEDTERAGAREQLGVSAEAE